MAGAVIFILLFICICALNSWKTYKAKTWFCISLCIGCFSTLLSFPCPKISFLESSSLTSFAVEFVGYAARAGAHNKTNKLMAYTIQSSWILIAPTLFAATIYMTFGRLVRKLGAQEYSILPARWLTKAFVLGDVLSFVLQGGAAGMLIVQSLAKIGKAMVILGLVIQVLSFGLFIVTAVIFHRRLGVVAFRVANDIDWIGIMMMLYTTSALVMIRSIYRLVEYSQGMDGYLMSNEWPAYVFDAVPMFTVTIIFFFKFPSQLQVNAQNIRDDESLDVIAVPAK